MGQDPEALKRSPHHENWLVFAEILYRRIAAALERAPWTPESRRPTSNVSRATDELSGARLFRSTPRPDRPLASPREKWLLLRGTGKLRHRICRNAVARNGHQNSPNDSHVRGARNGALIPD